MKKAYPGITYIPIFIILWMFINPLSAQTDLSFNFDKSHDMEISGVSENTISIHTTGKDPYVSTHPLSAPLSRKDRVLSFDYFCPKGLDHLEIFFDVENEHSKLVRRIGMSEGWVLFSVDLSEDIEDWGQEGDSLRLDFGNREGVNIQVRNLELRPLSEREREIAATREIKKRQEAILEQNLKDYLAADFPNLVDKVSVSSTEITIRGTASHEDSLFLCEVTPYMDVTESPDFRNPFSVKSRDFEFKVDRFIEKNGILYDRLLSKWVLVQKSDTGNTLKSHARYADDIASKYNLPEEVPTSKKGLGGFGTSRGHVEDLDELDITSATVNIWFTRFMYTTSAPDRIKHTYNGKDWYFGEKEVENLDATFKTTAQRNIITAAILLVSKAEQCPDPEIGRLLQHPDMDPAGIYSMPNMTNPESVECYAAALDFLANRYSRPDKKYGRINHWIMHNEVDAGWVWTNMGEKTELVFMDTYIKSMRMCYNIARTYNPHSEVFVTLTHYWAWTSHPKFYPSKNLMEILLDYTHTEGDFEWSLAHHPYPESLFEPKTWLDQKVDFTFDSPLITFKNLEVLDAWIKKPEVLYKGKFKRTLWLSENGTNSKTYSEQDLTEQAAGFAYTWKKLENLDGIDGFQWHNWFDHRGEGGLRIGLRRFPDDEKDPGGKKPVWFVYQAAGTENEDAIFDPYKKVIGIDHWDQVNFMGEIDPELREESFRDVKADTWVGTDALGRELPGYADCGPRKKDRYVGMFYFMTHLNTDGEGPYDVTKIKAENPHNPLWGKGSHYWGEPEIGYYLNNERWAIRRHAYQLVDAGVDVIIFDVTNDKTYPEVYIPLCEEWREMRANGEKTPYIAFLGSEISLNRLWEEFYKKGMYPDLWFRWKGKPLLLYGQHEIPSRNKVNEIAFSEDILNFFSLRQSWAWTSLPWYDNGKDEWPWVDHFPQTIGWHESPDIPENVPVAAAQHPLSNIGRSFHQFHQPETDKYDLTPHTGKGLFFQEQWDRALEVDPEFVFVTGWNEWSAEKQVMGDDILANLLKWNFYPGAHLGKAGKPLKPGDTYFIDQYNQEFSRDIEPMKGGHTDNYYYQLMANIRKYKGVSPPLETGNKMTIDLQGDWGQWENVTAVYLDHTGDITHRNSPGMANAGPYINTTGRNDIVETRVARDDDNIYFYVKTADDLSDHASDNWMLLFINADQDNKTGWQGYDYIINKEVIDNHETTLHRFHKDGWEKQGEISYRYSGNELMIRVPRQMIAQDKIAFDFHWADNIVDMDDMQALFLNGDHAPERRANYRYEE